MAGAAAKAATCFAALQHPGHDLLCVRRCTTARSVSVQTLRTGVEGLDLCRSDQAPIILSLCSMLNFILLTKRPFEGKSRHIPLFRASRRPSNASAVTPQ